MKKKVLDITSEKCPITFLKTKVFLQEHKNFHEKIILVRGKENLNSLKGSLKKNFEIKSKKIDEDIYKIIVK
tara:strand:+ start:206 stop:421 length:216 start_codon:yes stop_codon:yes gene_type:complete